MAQALLSQHLALSEFLDTSHRDLIEEQVRSFTPDLKANASRFALSVFEPVRAILGPCRISSGYRCPTLNKAVGGVPTSRHMVALAADLIPLRCGIVEGMDLLREAVKRGDLPFLDEAILEFGRWIHVQAALEAGEPRGATLMTFAAGSYEPFDVSDPRVVARRLA